MFELEFEIKMKAQMKYLEMKDKQKRTHGFRGMLQHDYLWTPTTTFYCGSFLLFLFVRNKMKMQMYNVIPFMIIPVTMDYLKREFFTSSFTKDKVELNKRKKVVQKIINEKKSHVTFEQVCRYLFKLNLDKPIHNQRDFVPYIF